MTTLRSDPIVLDMAWLDVSPTTEPRSAPPLICPTRRGSGPGGIRWEE